jgi:hypothetical protein
MGYVLEPTHASGPVWFWVMLFGFMIYKLATRPPRELYNPPQAPGNTD